MRSGHRLNALGVLIPLIALGCRLLADTSIAECEQLGEDLGDMNAVYTCYSILAERQADASICELIPVEEDGPGFVDRLRCYSRVAAVTGDLSLCTGSGFGVDAGIARDMCYSFAYDQACCMPAVMGREVEDPELCRTLEQLIPDESLRDCGP